MVVRTLGKFALTTGRTGPCGRWCEFVPQFDVAGWDVSPRPATPVYRGESSCAALDPSGRSWPRGRASVDGINRSDRSWQRGRASVAGIDRTGRSWQRGRTSVAGINRGGGSSGRGRASVAAAPAAAQPAVPERRQDPDAMFVAVGEPPRRTCAKGRLCGWMLLARGLVWGGLPGDDARVRRRSPPRPSVGRTRTRCSSRWANPLAELARRAGCAVGCRRGGV